MLESECDFCKEAKLVPKSCCEKFVKPKINNILKGKKCDYSFEVLKSFVKMDYNLERYIFDNHQKLYYKFGQNYYSRTGNEQAFYIKRIYLHNQKSAIKSTLIKC